MKLNYYYFEKEGKCFLCIDKSKPDYDKISKDTNVISIDIKNKNVHNLFEFFRKNTLKILSDGTKEIFEVNDSNIINEPFYSTDPFKKLMQLINDSIEKCNEIINDCK